MNSNETYYDIDYEINKRKSYIRHLTPAQYDYEMNYGSMSVPEPNTCPGQDYIDSCPRAEVMKHVYPSDPCEYCSHSLDDDYLRNYKTNRLERMR